MDKPTVFISYSHKDETWKDRLLPHLRTLEQLGLLVVWDDRRIDAGESWYPEIRQAIETAAVAICLISPDFLASTFCVKEEVPYLLERRERDGLPFLPILVHPCPWKLVPWLRSIQMLPRDGKSISAHYSNRYNSVFSEAVEWVAARVAVPKLSERRSAVAEETYHGSVPARKTPPSLSPHLFGGEDTHDRSPTVPKSPGSLDVFQQGPMDRTGRGRRPMARYPVRVDVDRLPCTGHELFGRREELRLLDEAWESDAIHVVSLVAWGGVGKSTLVNKWLELLAADGYQGAERVFAWSFQSQGSGEGVSSADLFFSAILRWFGVEDPSTLNQWQKADRLAELLHSNRTLLILDGLEPLQSPFDFERGTIKDPALEVLIERLTLENPGLCVLTSRERIPALNKAGGSAIQKDLEQISPEAGRALLRVGGVRGTDAELEDLSRAFGNHALAVRLLTAYLQDFPGHPGAAAAEIPDIDVPVEKGKHPRRVIAALENKLDQAPRELLRVLGLFDRPAKTAELDAVRAAPAIPGLTDDLHQLSPTDWRAAIDALRHKKLLAAARPCASDSLDAHPLVREHFAEYLRHNLPEGWKAGHCRLYDHLSQSSKSFPDTLDEMMPLYEAISHGCRAGLPREAMHEVYWPRVLRRDEHFSWKVLGALGADLAAISNFFDHLWDRPRADLDEDARGFMLNQVGIHLRSLGRLSEAAAPMRAGAATDEAREDWSGAAAAAGNLSELHLTLGQIQDAVAWGRRSAALADRSGDPLESLKQRTKLADALHQSGDRSQAASLFQAAERLQKESQSDDPLLYSLGGFRFCDLRLGECEALSWTPRQTSSHPSPKVLHCLSSCGGVRRHAAETLKWAERHGVLLDIALDHLTLARCYLLQVALSLCVSELLPAARDHVNQAVSGLRRAGQQQFLSLGFVATAQLCRLKLEHAQDTAPVAEAISALDQAEQIADRGPMPLFLADIALERSRLRYALGQPAAARKHLEKARGLVNKHGYHRRDAELEVLKQLLG